MEGLPGLIQGNMDIINPKSLWFTCALELHGYLDCGRVRQTPQLCGSSLTPVCFSSEPKVRRSSVCPAGDSDVAGCKLSLHVLSSACSVPAGRPPGSLSSQCRAVEPRCCSQWLTAVWKLPGPKPSLCHRPGMPCPHSYPPNWAFSLTVPRGCLVLILILLTLAQSSL